MQFKHDFNYPALDNSIPLQRLMLYQIDKAQFRQTLPIKRDDVVKNHGEYGLNQSGHIHEG